MLAGLTTSSPPLSWHARATTSSSAPRIAAMLPVPTGTASCISRPRSRTIETASGNPSVPAATLAEYSPRL